MYILMGNVERERLVVYTLSYVKFYICLFYFLHEKGSGCVHLLFYSING